MSNSPDGIYEKGIIDPETPVKNSIKSYWLTEPAPIAKLQSPWLDSADVVIIGSGMTAASLARTLYARSTNQNLKIVLLEARDVCSGATGRNGGHCKPMSPGAWFDRKLQFGTKEAIQIMEYEHSHVDEMIAFLRDNGIECDFNLLEGLDIYYDPKVFQRACDAVEDMKREAPSLGDRYTVYTSKSDLKAHDVPDGSVGAIGTRAASMWPYKLVTAFLQSLIDKNGLNIQSNTPVTSITEGKNNATIITDRGQIEAPIVVHATNCWIGHLVPELRPFVSPVRANVQRQETNPIKMRPAKSWWLRYGEKDYDYMMQRPDGAFIVGRASTGRRATSDDSEVDFLPHVHLRSVTPQIFDFGTKDIKATHQWSGAVGFTLDGNPFVGRLPFPNRSHQWVCAAYQGIGMVRAFRSAQMLAHLILDEELPACYPRSMLLTESRVEGWKKELGIRAKSKL
ncbi:hypothetical protein FSARC_12844 [Fusarium sarcochroum]|uniref:FAD dependent oxidoreductase domain-containing protein n=1 Tax=Fusarium sarcochroum TaxID=1208366 RepID=A0A8H4WVV1_9HYPO|nr:hypothetical protein FSARC_12844 [Fusarium sarcochroum]